MDTIPGEDHIPSQESSENDDALLADLAAALDTKHFDPSSPDNIEAETDKLVRTVAAAEIEELPVQIENEFENPLEAAYVENCRTKDIQPCFEHQQIFKQIPVDLLVDITSKLPEYPGGAIIRLDNGHHNNNEKHIEAFLKTISSPISTSSNKVLILLLDHLDLSNTPLSTQLIQSFVHRAASLGPYWRLRSLSLSSCSLNASHLECLFSFDSQPFLWHLQRLDLSNNSHLFSSQDDDDNNTTNHQSINLSLNQCSKPSILFFLHLWKFAPLRCINLANTGIDTPTMVCMLRLLRTYPLPSVTPLGCGISLQDGTRASLEYIKLGECDTTNMPKDTDTTTNNNNNINKTNTNNNTNYWSRALIDELSLFIKACPSLIAIEFIFHQKHINTEFKSKISSFWTEKYANHPIMIAEVQPGILRCSARYAVQHLASIESAPTQHTLPKQTPSSTAPSAILHASRNGPPHDVQGRQAPALLDDWGLGTALQNQPPPHENATIGGAAKSFLLPPRCPQNTTTTRNTKNTRKNINRGGREKKVYHGSRNGDQIPDNGIDLLSEEDDSQEEEEEDDSQDEEDIVLVADHQHCNPVSTKYANITRDTHGNDTPDHININTTNAAAMNEPFRLRDGALDRDSHLGKMYRSDAKRYIKERITNPSDQKKARRAFQLWDGCAENAWDRHRWDRPSKTQNDEAHLLGQLNALYDIFDAYNCSIGFPFPMWRKGKGERAFEVNTHKRKKSSDVIDDAGDGGQESKKESKEESKKESKEHENDDIVVIDTDEKDKDKPSPQHTMTCTMKSKTIIDDDDDDWQHTIDTTTTDPHIHHLASSSCIDTLHHSSKRERELSRLAAWSWDSRKDDHPPNEDMYGIPTEGKRRRRGRSMRGVDNNDLIEDDLMAGNDDEKERKKKKKKRSVFIDDDDDNQRDGDVNAMHDPSDDDDDDIPLGQITKEKQQRAEMTVKTKTTIPMNENVPPIINTNGPCAVVLGNDAGDSQHKQKSALDAARALLGTLYSPSSILKKTMPCTENVHGSEFVVPDSQEDQF